MFIPKKCTGPTSAELLLLCFCFLADAVLSTSKIPDEGKLPVLTCHLDFFLNHLDFRHLLDEAALDSHSASLGKATPAKTSPLPGRVLASRLADSGWQRKLCQHRVQEVFQDTPSHWAKLSALGTAATRAKSCSAHGSCTSVAEGQSVLL